MLAISNKIREKKRDFSGGGSDEWIGLLGVKKEQILEFYTQIRKISLEYDKYADFDFLPIKLTYKDLIPKTKRFKKIFLCDSNHKKVNQIGSRIIKKRDCEDGYYIELIYSCSRKDIENTIQYIGKILRNEKLPSLLDQANELIEKQNLRKNNLKIAFDEKIKKSDDKEYKNRLKSDKKEAIKESEKDFLSKITALVKECNFKQHEITTVILMCNNLSTIDIVENDLWVGSPHDLPIISFFSIKDLKEIVNILKENNIEIYEGDFILDHFINLPLDVFNQINSKFPFLISTASSNEPIVIEPFNNEHAYGTNELFVNVENIANLHVNDGIVGVVDSYGRFDFIKEYVDYKEIPFLDSTYQSDYDHGTQVTSLIVSPKLSLNSYDDGYGIFKVKHFGLLPKNSSTAPFYVFDYMKNVWDIVSGNPEIKVWNFSIDAKNDSSSISTLGRFFDRLLMRFPDIIFVISIGNGNFDSGVISGGADSLSSISVGGAIKSSTDDCYYPTSYSPQKTIFNLYKKPDVYGLSNDLEVYPEESVLLLVDSKGRLIKSDGSSFSTPFITRQVADIIYNKKLKPESAKAILSHLSQAYTTSNDVLIPNLNEIYLNKDDIYYLIEGSIEQKESQELQINLPIEQDGEKSLTNFNFSHTLSYKVNNFKDVGDEYSSTDISVSLYSYDGEKDLLLDKVGKAKNDKSRSGYTKESKLRSAYGKYNTNSTLVSKGFDFDDSKVIGIVLSKEKLPEVFNGNSRKFIIKVKRTDLFDEERLSKNLNYSILIHLKPVHKGDLDTFIQDNEEYIDQVIDISDVNTDLEIEL